MVHKKIQETERKVWNLAVLILSLSKLPTIAVKTDNGSTQLRAKKINIKVPHTGYDMEGA